jgi:sulfur carrier protein
MAAAIQSCEETMHKLRRTTVGFAHAAGDNARMDIVLNGEPRSLESGLTVSGLLQLEGLAERRVAVEVNGGIVPRGRHGEHALRDGDRIEIVHALGGG